MDGQSIITLFATLVLIYAMYYTHKLNKTQKH